MFYKGWTKTKVGILALLTATSATLVDGSNPRIYKPLKNETTIRIAYIGGLSGRNAQSAQKSLQALNLAVEKFNSAGGIRGKQIKIIPFDNESTPSTNLALFEQVKEARVSAITGVHISNDGLLLARLAETEKIPMVVASATHPEISKNKKYVVQICFSDDLIGRYLANFAKHRLKSRRIVTITDVSDSAALRVSSQFSRHFTLHKGMIVGNYNIRSGDQDFYEIINKLRGVGGIDSIFISASSIESSFLIRQLYENEIRLPLLGTDNWQNQDLARALLKLNQRNIRAYFPAHWHIGIKNPAATELRNKFLNVYHESITSFDADPALTYDAGIVLIQAMIRSQSTDPEKIISAIKTNFFEGTTGKIQFDPNGVLQKDIHMLKFSTAGVTLVDGNL